MSRSSAILFALLFVVSGFGAAQKVVKRGPIQPTSPASGREMYMEYCAVCHGKDAKGGGPAASELKRTPPDLSTLAKRNGGKFPYTEVSNTLRFGTTVPAHGSREMPIWGRLFGSLNTSHDVEVHQRVVNLTNYLASVQTK